MVPEHGTGVGDWVVGAVGAGVGASDVGVAVVGDVVGTDVGDAVVVDAVGETLLVVAGVNDVVDGSGVVDPPPLGLPVAVPTPIHIHIHTGRAGERERQICVRSKR